MRYSTLLLLFTIPLGAQPTPGGGGGSAIACVGTPGNTTGSYRQFCASSGGSVYICNNSAGCTVAADWASVTGSGSFTYPSGTGLVQVTTGSAWGTTLANPLTAANGGTGSAFFAVAGPATSTKTFTFPNASANVLTDNALVTAAQGGTANGFFAVSGPATSTKTYTFPNASTTILTTNAAVTAAQGGTGGDSSGSTGIAHVASGTWSYSTIATADIAANAVTSAKTAVVNTRRVCDLIVGDASGSVITNGQLGPQKRACYIPAAAAVVEMDVAADGGTPNVIIGVNHAGTTSNIVSAALATAASGGIACSNTGGTTGIDGATTCTNTLQNTSMAAGDYLELVSGTAGGTAKLMTIHVIYTIN